MYPHPLEARLSLCSVGWFGAPQMRLPLRPTCLSAEIIPSLLTQAAKWPGCVCSSSQALSQPGLGGPPGSGLWQVLGRGPESGDLCFNFHILSLPVGSLPLLSTMPCSDKQ